MAKGQKVALLNLDITGAFDFLPHGLVNEGFRLSGATTSATSLVKSYLKNQSQFLKIGGEKSAKWRSPDTGVFQGVHLAGLAYNVSTLGHSSPEELADSTTVRYSDDYQIVVSGPNNELLKKRIIATIIEKEARINTSGMTLEPKKTEFIQMNSQIQQIEIAGIPITIKNDTKFLGMSIQKNLGVGIQLQHVCAKIRQAAGRTRSYRNVPSAMKLPLYYAWAQSQVTFNGAAFLPFLSANQKKKLQRSCNQAIRAVVGTKARPKTGEMIISATFLRRKLKISSIETLERIAIAKRTWKNRINLQKMQSEQLKIAETRTQTRSGNILTIPKSNGPLKSSLLPKCAKCWNKMPQSLKDENFWPKAKKGISRWVRGAVPTHKKQSVLPNYGRTSSY